CEHAVELAHSGGPGPPSPGVDLGDGGRTTRVLTPGPDVFDQGVPVAAGVAPPRPTGRAGSTPPAPVRRPHACHEPTLRRGCDRSSLPAPAKHEEHHG